MQQTTEDTNVQIPDAINTDSEYNSTLLRVEQVLAKFASTLALRPIGCEVILDPYCSAPAWSTESDMFINVAQIDPDNINVIQLRGLGLHETAHILLTPRMGTPIVTKVRKDNVFESFNILEDQRIEMAMVQMYSGVSDWLTGVIAEHILNIPDSVQGAHMLLHGRKYLDKSIRDLVRDSYVEQDKVASISAIIDEYITINLADNKTHDRAFELVKEFDALRKSGKYWTHNQAMSDPHGHTKRTDKDDNKRANTHKPLDKKQQQELADKIADAVQTDKAQPSDASNTPSGGGAGDESDASEQAKDWADKTLEQVKRRHRKSIDNMSRQITGEAGMGAGRKVKPLDADKWYQAKPSPEAISAVKSFSRELQLLQSDYAAGWVRKVDKGRLNVQRYMSGTDLDECYDLWDDGRDNATDIECVILTDVSGSMSHMLDDTMASMWAIKRSLETIGASTTVITFDDKTRVLYKSTDRAGRKGFRYPRERQGGTEPTAALQQARQILAQSNRSVKILIVLTDGEWYRAAAPENIIRQLRANGVATALGFLDMAPNWWNEAERGAWSGNNAPVNAHGCEVGVHIKRVSQLHTLARGIVEQSIKRMGSQ